MGTVLYRLAINLFVLLAFSISQVCAEAVVPQECTAQNAICDAAKICNYKYRVEFEPDEENKSVFEYLISTTENKLVRKSCEWKVGLVSPSGAVVYDR